MTREEAIKELKESLDTLREYDIAHSSRLKQSLEMAIRTLENHDIFMKRAYSQGKQDALSQEPCEDVVSRILKRMWNCRGKHTTSIDKVKMEQIIRDALPSVTTMRDATPEEQKSVNDYIKSISTPTGVKFSDVVSRDAVIKAVDAHTNEDGTLDDDISVILEDLPPVNPQYTGNEFFNFDAPMVKKSMEQDAISREAVLNLCTNDSYKIPYEYEDDKGIHRGYDEYRLINYYKLKLLSPVTPQPSEHFIDGVHAIGYREGYKDAQKQKSGKWISVSERLPEESDCCLCCDKDGYMTIGGISKWSKEWYFDDDEVDMDVVAWMPLPKPYEPQERSDKE